VRRSRFDRFITQKYIDFLSIRKNFVFAARLIPSSGILRIPTILPKNNF
jgi:hypothetical protein